MMTSNNNKKSSDNIAPARPYKMASKEEVKSTIANLM